MLESTTQCVLSARTVCAVVVGMAGSLLGMCVCVSVGWCQYLTGGREILKRGVSGGPYLHPDF